MILSTSFRACSVWRSQNPSNHGIRVRRYSHTHLHRSALLLRTYRRKKHDSAPRVSVHTRRSPEQTSFAHRHTHTTYTHVHTYIHTLRTHATLHTHHTQIDPCSQLLASIHTYSKRSHISEHIYTYERMYVYIYTQATDARKIHGSDLS